MRSQKKMLINLKNINILTDYSKDKPDYHKYYIQELVKIA